MLTWKYFPPLIIRSIRVPNYCFNGSNKQRPTTIVKQRICFLHYQPHTPINSLLALLKPPCMPKSIKNKGRLLLSQSFLSSSRDFHAESTVSTPDIEGSIGDLKNELFLQVSRRKLVAKKIKVLKKLLSQTENDAETIIKRHPQLCNRSDQDLTSSVKFLSSKGVSLDKIVDMPWLLLYKPCKLLFLTKE